MISTEVMGLGRMTSEVSAFLLTSRVHVISTTITGDDDLDHLADAVFAKFLHCKLILPLPSHFPDCALWD